MIEAMKQALEALESCTPADTSTGHVVWPSYDEQAVAQAKGFEIADHSLAIYASCTKPQCPHRPLPAQPASARPS
jgi:hypothetical protein